MGYTPNYSHLVGIMIINHWVYGYTIFRHTQICGGGSVGFPWNQFWNDDRWIPEQSDLNCMEECFKLTWQCSIFTDQIYHLILRWFLLTIICGDMVLSCFLSGWWFQPLWKISQLGLLLPTIWEKIQTTKQLFIIHPNRCTLWWTNIAIENGHL